MPRSKGEHLGLLTRERATREIFVYIETLDNREGIHTVMGKLFPLEFEAQTHTAQWVMLEAA